MMRNDNLQGMTAPLFDAETLERLYGEPDKARPFRASQPPCDDETAFLVEVHQAGIFQLANFPDGGELQHVLAAYCPSVILPFAREAIANLIGRTGYPPVMLQPINFDALYAQHLAQQAANGANGAAPTTVQ